VRNSVLVVLVAVPLATLLASWAGFALAQLVFVALAVPLRILGALALALLLQRRERLAVPGRLAVYSGAVLPHAATALIFLWLVNPVYGPLALVLQLGGDGGGPLLLDRLGAQLTIVAIAVFALGEGFLVLLAPGARCPRCCTTSRGSRARAVRGCSAGSPCRCSRPCSGCCRPATSW
jgi:hypothetical protein